MLPVVGTLAATMTKRDTTPVGAVNPNPDSDDSIMDLALVITPAHQAPSVDTPSEQMPEQALDQQPAVSIQMPPPLALPDVKQ